MSSVIETFFPAENAVPGLLGYSLTEYCVVTGGGGSKREKQMPKELQLKVNNLYRDRKESAH